jgi:hypothetical protein
LNWKVAVTVRLLQPLLATDSVLQLLQELLVAAAALVLLLGRSLLLCELSASIQSVCFLFVSELYFCK